MIKSVVLAAVALVAGASSAGAQNIVTNPGFETGDLTGWSPAGDFATGFNRVDVSGFRGVTPAYGSYLFLTGNFASQGLGGISQTLTTVAGQYYDISLEWTTEAGNDADNQLFQVLWNNTVVIQTQGSPASLNFKLLTGGATGTGSDTLTILGYTSSGYNEVDQVSVTAGIAPPSVPEPISWAMFIAGFGMTGAAMRGRRKLAVSFG